MPAQTKRSRNSAKPKLFQCTGYGDCRMVFTRSEHLARHARKHTGEKPFKCIVPECDKMFSRFDNMMQHTQTHRSHRPSHSSLGTDHAGPGTRSSTRMRQQHREAEQQRRRSTDLHVDTVNDKHDLQSRRSSVHNDMDLISPVSLASPESFSSVDSEPEEDLHPHPSTTTTEPKSRRLSVADLCNPVDEKERLIHLTKDEFEALQGFSRFGQPSTFYLDSLQSLVP
ncbi:uncharacterized protein BYT42DRAFT_611277 [Radiomyces spectabilis]|uniref:uncharacterized protein n=1 Tax=Radiomyces spectabilis TaxID=64574 RepID=UPI00221F7413|nr:uncharacterized protein BYT42DRAFT_611277 [Radiomyces spectabilis]KAI8388208.1 hypothetical protein BYT42DRAFT_611277 [Radiomyces spectabilis]